MTAWTFISSWENFPPRHHIQTYGGERNRGCVTKHYICVSVILWPLSMVRTLANCFHASLRQWYIPFQRARDKKKKPTEKVIIKLMARFEALFSALKFNWSFFSSFGSLSFSFSLNPSLTSLGSSSSIHAVRAMHFHLFEITYSRNEWVESERGRKNVIWSKRKRYAAYSHRIRIWSTELIARIYADTTQTRNETSNRRKKLSKRMTDRAAIANGKKSTRC